MAFGPRVCGPLSLSLSWGALLVPGRTRSHIRGRAHSDTHTLSRLVSLSPGVSLSCLVVYSSANLRAAPWRLG
ncbi:hypothetical protein LY76DRAFT_598017 [Colletotrichum caudatum]|nr:hypothetical protein LY76DRAFT_598017 [Colletotrichum caudatum]